MLPNASGGGRARSEEKVIAVGRAERVQPSAPHVIRSLRNDEPSSHACAAPCPPESRRASSLAPQKPGARLRPSTLKSRRTRQVTMARVARSPRRPSLAALARAGGKSHGICARIRFGDREERARQIFERSWVSKETITGRPNGPTRRAIRMNGFLGPSGARHSVSILGISAARDDGGRDCETIMHLSAAIACLPFRYSCRYRP